MISILETALVALALGMIASFLLSIVARAIAKHRKVETPTVKYDLIPMVIEEHDGVFYTFNDITGGFVCQGKDTTQIQEAFAARYPQSHGIIVRIDDRVLEILKNQGMTCLEVDA